MMNLTIFKHSTLALIVGISVIFISGNIQADDRLSAEKWSADLAQEYSKNSNKTASPDFEKIEKKTFADCDDCENKIKMQTARKLFAKGQYEEARALYSQISKASPYWLESVEEKAWTYFRQDQLESALAQAKTLLAPQFATYVGSEAYFLQSLAFLKSCNYKGVFETNRLFKEKQKSRLAEIQTLTKTGMNEALKNVMSQTDKFPLKFSDIGENASHLPHLFFKDLKFQRQLMRYKLSEKALAALNPGEIPLALQNTLENVKAISASLLQNRIKELATEETNDNFKIVQKLNLVEIEAIQRLHADLDLDKSFFKKGPFLNTTSDQLVFVDDGRPWIDELDKYEVRTKTCPANLRRKM